MNAAELHDQLRQRAFLHDDPEAYLAGVDDVLHLIDAEAAVAAVPVEAADSQRQGA
jgi:hypothetical protein